MTTGFRSPYKYFKDEMDRIPFDGPSWETWQKEGARKKRFFLYQFMIWTYIFIATAVLALPFWYLTGIDHALGIPLLFGGAAFMLFGSYKNTGELL
jgi:hypothetical protein